MKQLFIVNPDSFTHRLEKIMQAMGCNVQFNDSRSSILLEIELTSSDLPCLSSSRGDSGFSMSDHTLFWGLQWIGTLGSIKYNEKNTPFLTFPNAGLGLECLDRHYEALLRLPTPPPETDMIESPTKKVRSSVDATKYIPRFFSPQITLQGHPPKAPLQINRKLLTQHVSLSK